MHIYIIVCIQQNISRPVAALITFRHIFYTLAYINFDLFSTIAVETEERLSA